MITLKEYLETVNYRITEGSEYYCKAFGNNLYCLSAWNGDHDGWSANIVIDTKTQTSCMVEVCDYKNSRAYRLINPDLKDKFMKDDSEYRDQAWDDVDYIDLESDDDWIQKSLAIVAGEDYDERVSVPLDLPKDELFELMRMAHERDLTLNELVEEALQSAIKEFERDPEGMRAKAQQWKNRAQEASID